MVILIIFLNFYIREIMNLLYQTTIWKDVKRNPKNQIFSIGIRSIKVGKSHFGLSYEDTKKGNFRK